MAESKKKATEKTTPTSKARSIRCLRCGAREISNTGYCKCGYYRPSAKK